MSYLAFLIVLFSAGAVFGSIRLFVGKASFEGVFKVFAIGVVMLPVAVGAFLFCAGIAMAITLMASAILNAAGLLPTVESWSVWSLFPAWVWIVVGAFSVFAALSTPQIYSWIKRRQRIV
jgi:hypothetical protein